VLAKLRVIRTSSLIFQELLVWHPLTSNHGAVITEVSDRMMAKLLVAMSYCASAVCVNLRELSQYSMTMRATKGFLRFQIASLSSFVMDIWAEVDNVGAPGKDSARATNGGELSKNGTCCPSMRIFSWRMTSLQGTVPKFSTNPSMVQEGSALQDRLKSAKRSPLIKVEINAFLRPEVVQRRPVSAGVRSVSTLQRLLNPNVIATCAVPLMRPTSGRCNLAGIVARRIGVEWTCNFGSGCNECDR